MMTQIVKPVVETVTDFEANTHKPGRRDESCPPSALKQATSAKPHYLTHTAHPKWHDHGVTSKEDLTQF